MTDRLHALPSMDPSPPAEHDPVDAAITAIEHDPEMLQMTGRLASGHPFFIVVPAGISALEACALVGWLGIELSNRINARPASRILVPT